MFEVPNLMGSFFMIPSEARQSGGAEGSGAEPKCSETFENAKMKYLVKKLVSFQDSRKIHPIFEYRLTSCGRFLWSKMVEFSSLF